MSLWNEGFFWLFSFGDRKRRPNLRHLFRVSLFWLRRGKNRSNKGFVCLMSGCAVTAIHVCGGVLTSLESSSGTCSIFWSCSSSAPSSGLSVGRFPISRFQSPYSLRLGVTWFLKFRFVLLWRDRSLTADSLDSESDEPELDSELESDEDDKDNGKDGTTGLAVFCCWSVRFCSHPGDLGVSAFSIVRILFSNSTITSRALVRALLQFSSKVVLLPRGSIPFGDRRSICHIEQSVLYKEASKL